MSDVEDNESIRNANRHLKKKKRKHLPTSESNLMLQENTELKLIDDGESNKKKHNEPCDTEKSYERVNTNFNEDTNELSSSNNPQKKRKKKEHKEKTNQSLDKCITEPFIKIEVSDAHDDHVKKSKKKKCKEVALAQEEESIPQGKVKKRKYPMSEAVGTHLPSTDFLESSDIPLKKSKKHKHNDKTSECSVSDSLPIKLKKKHKKNAALPEDIADEHREQNADYLYKKKKKKKGKVSCELDQSEHTESEVYGNHVKKSKKKKHKEVALAQEEEEQEKVKKKKYPVSETVGTNLSKTDFPESSDIPLEKSKKNKHKDKISEFGISDYLPIKLKKEHKKNVAMLEESVDEPSQNIEQNGDYLYKKKKKEKGKVNCALDHSTDHIEIEVYVKKSKKKHKEVASGHEEEASLPQEKVKKRKYPASETVGTHLPSTDFLESSDIPLEKSKKDKHKDKTLEFSTSDFLPAKLKKKKHEKNVVLPEDTQLSFFVDGSASKTVNKEKHTELVEMDCIDATTEEIPSVCEHEDGSIFEKNKKHESKIHLHSMEQRLCDTNDFVLGNLTDRDTPVRSSSPMSIKQSVDSSHEGNTSKHINQSIDDTAMSESVFDDTFTLEVHEFDGLDDTIVSSNVAEVEPHSKKEYTDDSGEDMFDHSNANQNCVKSEANTRQKVRDISVKTAPLKKGHPSYQQLLERVKDASQPKEDCKSTIMHITVPWPVPPLHLIETRVCGRPTSEQRTKMKELGENIKSGIYSRSEDDQIKKNWREFCQIHDLQNEDPTPFLNFMQAGGSLTLSTAERINFVRFLAHGLHNRPLNSVYKRFQRIFLAEKIVTGRFSPEEDEIIREYMESTSRRTPYSDLAKILKRDRLAVEKRCKSLECIDGNGDRSMKWEKENIEEFLKHILKITESDSLNDLKDREIKPQEWKALSEKLGISTTKLRRAWSCTIYPKLFISNNGVSSHAIKIALINKLIENNENDWRVVNWEQMAKDFDGFTGLKLNKFMKDVVHYHVPQDMHNNLGECLQYLKNLISQKKNFLRRSLKKIKINESLLLT